MDRSFLPGRGTFVHGWTVSTTFCPVRCHSYANWVQRCHPVLPLLKAVGTVGVCEARKVLGHHLLTPISALSTSRLLLPKVQVTKHFSVQLSGQTSPALPTGWQTCHPLCGLTPLHLGRNPKAAVSLIWLFSKTRRLPDLLPTAGSRTPWCGSDSWWLSSSAPFPGQGSPTPLSTH